jgi:hypothetical protein
MKPYEAFWVGIATAVGALALVVAVYTAGQHSAQKEVRHKCERFKVVDLPMVGATFYCAREPQPSAGEKK